MKEALQVAEQRQDSQEGQNEESQSVLEKVITHLQPALRYTYQNAWGCVLKVIKEAMKALVRGQPKYGDQKGWKLICLFFFDDLVHRGSISERTIFCLHFRPTYDHHVDNFVV